MFSCGLLIGVATAFKQVAAASWPLLLVLYPIFFGGEKRLRNTWSFATCSAIGFVAVWAIIVAYFYSRNGLHDLTYNVLTHNLEYINTIPWSERLKLLQKTLGQLAPTQGAVWIFALVGLIGVWKAGRIGLLLFLLQWFLASVAGVGASGYFFPHYFQQALPVLCVAAALGGEQIARADFWGRAPERARKTIVALVACALPAIFVVPFLFQSPDEVSKTIYPSNHFPEMQRIGKRLAEVTTPADKVYVFGAEPEVLFYGKRVSATRYIFLFPLYGSYRDAREKQMATIEEIETNRPGALLYMPNSLFFTKGTEQQLTQWTQAALMKNFSGDLWLAADQGGSGHLYSGQGIRPPPETRGQRVLGGLFVRKPATSVPASQSPEH